MALVVVCGPTASRKSELAMGLAERLPGELVCCDSVQIYRGFEVGSAAPTSAERAAIPHHLFGILEADDPGDAGRYARQADEAIADITSRGRRAILVGGTGLYLRSLLWGLAPMPQVPAAVQQALIAEHAAGGIEPLWARLQAADPVLAARIEGGPANTQRVLRGLEVYEGTGQRLSDLQASHTPTDRYDTRILTPGFEPPVLAERIDQRVDRMLAGGLLDEVRGLLASGVSPDSRPMRALGYRQAVAHLAGELSLEEAALQIKRSHRQYARRQRTWFKKTPGVTRLDGTSASLVDDALKVINAEQAERG